jgi:GNAT superfamily N-acetyltransferase
MLQGDEVAASVKLTVTRHPSAYATLGEVATHPSFRRRGIAQELCRRAQDDFRSLGGQMIALGTGNPVAARRYFALGYRRLPGTAVWWNNVGDCRSPEEWAVDYFRAAEAAALAAGSGDLTKALSIAEGTPMARVRMLPLIHHPHQSLLSLDANVGLYSTRVSIVTSVNGLYPRYNSLPVESCGQWWTAQTCKMETDGREQIGTLVGLATAWFDPASQHGVLWVDGFLHGKWSAGWAKLMHEGPLRWATADGRFTRARARVPKGDATKLALFRSLGFEVASTPGLPFQLVCSYPVEGDGARPGEVREQDSVLLQLRLPRAAH